MGGGGGTEDIVVFSYSCGIEIVIVIFTVLILSHFKVLGWLSTIAQPTDKVFGFGSLVCRTFFPETNMKLPPTRTDTCQRILHSAASAALRGNFQRLSQDSISVELETLRAPEVATRKKESFPSCLYKMWIPNTKLRTTKKGMIGY